MNVKTLFAQASSLSLAERCQLIDDLDQTVIDEAGLFNESDLAEWRRRSDELERHPERGMTWDQIKSQLKLPRS